MNLYSRIHAYSLWPLLERREHLHTGGHLGFLKAGAGLTLEQLRTYQLGKLKLLLRHAYDNTIFYKRRFDQIGFHPDDLSSLEDLKKIPPVTRQDLNEHLEDMIARNISEKERHYASTGGSTGLATRFARDNGCLSIKKAAEYRFNTWMGWKPGDKILYYWPALTDFSSEGSKTNCYKSLLLYRSLRLFAGRLNEKILAEHVRKYIAFKPSLIRAFPSALQRFAEYALNSGVSLPEPRGIITVGEPLIETQRNLFRDIFHSDVFNCYVSRECGNIGCECPAHNGMHIAEEMVYLEIEARKEGEFGEILLTDLWNMGMPLIRYRIQDAAKWVDGFCSCGRQHRRIGVEAARISDFLISPINDSYISGATLLHYLLAEGPQIGRVKLLQDAKDHLNIIIAGDKVSSQAGVKHIKSKLEIIFEGSMKVDFTFVEEIPLLPSGKYQFVQRLYVD